MRTENPSIQSTSRSEEVLTSSLQSVTGEPPIDALSKAAEKALDQILSRAAADRPSARETNGEKRLFFRMG